MEMFSEDEIIKLNSILKLILPVGESRMPQAEIILYSLDFANTNHIMFVELIKEIINKISVNLIISEEDLNQFKKSNFRGFSVFVNLVLIHYYSNKAVLNKLEVGSVPPFPEGNFVKEGDIYLLESVFLKEKIYRE